MRRFRILLGHEWRGAIKSPVTWLIIGLAWILFGAQYTQSILPGSTDPDLRSTDLLLVTWQSSIFAVYLMLLVVPLLAMKSISEEKRSGTFEMLVTTPAKDHEIVLAKFFALFAIVALIWAILPVNALLLATVDREPDWGCVACSYLAIVGIGGLFLSVSLLASALTRHLLLAGFLAFVLVMAVVFLPALARKLPETWSDLRGVLGLGDLLRQTEEAARGLLDLVHLAYRVALTAFFLFVTVRVLEMRKWL